jgi:hypothetical protein
VSVRVRHEVQEVLSMSVADPTYIVCARSAPFDPPDGRVWFVADTRIRTGWRGPYHTRSGQVWPTRADGGFHPGVRREDAEVECARLNARENAEMFVDVAPAGWPH